MENFYLLTFQNTHKAIHAETILKQNKIKVTVVPTPTVITKSCGISIKISIDSINEIQELINIEAITVNNIYVNRENEYKVFKFEK